MTVSCDLRLDRTRQDRAHDHKADKEAAKDRRSDKEIYGWHDDLDTGGYARTRALQTTTVPWCSVPFVLAVENFTRSAKGKTASNQVTPHEVHSIETMLLMPDRAILEPLWKSL